MIVYLLAYLGYGMYKGPQIKILGVYKKIKTAEYFKNKNHIETLFFTSVKYNKIKHHCEPKISTTVWVLYHIDEINLIYKIEGVYESKNEAQYKKEELEIEQNLQKQISDKFYIIKSKLY